MIILQIAIPETLPLWVGVLLVVLGALGTFYGQIRSAIELMILGRKEVKLRKTQIEDKHVRLITRMSAAMVLLIDDYEDKYPGNTTFVQQIRALIDEANTM